MSHRGVSHRVVGLAGAAGGPVSKKSRLPRFQQNTAVIRPAGPKVHIDLVVVEDSANYQVDILRAEEIVATADAFFSPKVSLSVDKVLALFERARLQEKNTSGPKEAVEWATEDGVPYQIDPALVAENDALLRAHGFDFEKLVARKQATNVDRFSVEKVMSLSPDNPEISKLLELAQGMKTELPPDFECNGKLPSEGFSGSYRQVAPAIHKLLMAIHAKGLAVIFTAAMAWHVFGLHFGVAMWVPKTGKAAGRPVQDLSHCNGDPLNSLYAKKKADERYGGIVHPVIGALAIMVDDTIEAAMMSDLSLTMKDFTLHKMRHTR
jgi:hypothetical protein